VNRAATVACCLLAVLAGCSVAPATDTPTGQTITATISNDSPRSYSVELTALPQGVDAVMVTTANGSQRTYPSMSAVPAGISQNVTDLDVTGTDAQTVTHRLPPGTGIGTGFEDVPRNTTLVYALREPGVNGTVRSWGATVCRDTARMSFTFTVDTAGNVSAATACTA
jgi:hypothetical protein